MFPGVNIFNGQYTRQFDQNIDFFLDISHVTRGGVCAGLSMYWLRHKRTNTMEVFWGSLNRPSGIKFVENVQALEETNNFGCVLESLARIGLTANSFTQRTTRTQDGCFFQGHEIGYDISEANGYKYIAFTGIGGGHACAAYCTDDSIDYFDPNYGEVHFNSKYSFRMWFTYFWQNSDYHTDFSSGRYGIIECT